jgi:hypothetical protein
MAHKSERASPGIVGAGIVSFVPDMRRSPCMHADFPNFSLLCYWFDDMEGLLCVEKEGDSVTLVSSPLEAEVTRRDMPRRLPRSGPPRPRLRRQRRRERSPLRPRRGDRRGGRRTGIRLTKSPSADRYVERCVSTPCMSSTGSCVCQAPQSQCQHYKLGMAHLCWAFAPVACPRDGVL